MNEARLDYLNMGLMAVSLIAAFILPFEVFLFSYGILGPLHYLTEISWLHDRKYFSPKKFDWIPLVFLSIAILLGSSTVIGKPAFEFLQKIGIGDFFSDYSTDMTFIAFGIALIFILLKNNWGRAFGVLGVVIAAFVFHDMTNQDKPWTGVYWSIFALYVPTLLHVYVFTMLFMLFGALKRQSITGQISVLFMILCAILPFILFRDTSYYHVTDWGKENYANTFQTLSQFTLFHFGNYSLTEVGKMDLFSHPASVMLGRFIAFAYTYHYLNWFSKTNVIGWHRVPKLRFIAVILMWIGSVTLYLMNYQIGFRWLFLLSFAHVLLEFPLNHQSFIGIGKEVKMRLNGEKKRAAASKAG